MSDRRPVVACGDPHGDWKPLLEMCERVNPSAVVLVGDCDLSRPLRETLADLWSAGTAVHYIPGNHDTDAPEWWANLVGDHPTGNLNGRVETIEGMRIAGLGGIFAGKIWFPKAADEVIGPNYASREDWLRKNQHHRFRNNMQPRDLNGLPLKQRTYIYPEDVEALERIRREDGAVDILVTHEAPPTHQHGFYGIQMAAEACGARLVIHGHHHYSYTGVLPNGCKVRGLAKAEPWVIDLGG